MPDDPFASLPISKKRKKRKKPGIFDDVTGGASSASAEDDPFAKLPVQQRKKPSAGAFLAPIASGLTLGASDEILGGIEGLSNLGKQGGFSEGYERGKAKVRGVGKDYAEAHPILSPALELAGGIAAPGFGAARFAAGKIGKSALAGAGLGAASGAAYGDEGHRVSGATVGAGVGGVLGGGAVAGGKLLGGIANQLGWRSAKASEKIGVQKAIEALRRDKITPEMLGQTEADALSTNTPLRLFDMGGQNTSGLARAAQAVPSRARDELPDILHGRHSGQPERIFGQAEQAMGVKGRDLFEVGQEVMARAKEKARPLYDAAHSHGPIDDPDISEAAQLLEALVPQAKAAALKLAKAEGIAADRLFPTIRPPEPLAAIRTAQSPPPSLREAIEAFQTRSGKAATRHEGTTQQQAARQSLERHSAEAEALSSPIRGAPRSELQPSTKSYQAPSLIYLDYLKRGVDEVLGRAPLEGIGKQQAAAIRGIKNRMLRRVDEIVPVYGEARQAWAGDMAHSRALEMGSRVFGKSKKPQASIEKRLATMSDSEREMFKIGTLGAVRDILQGAGDNTDKVRRLLGSPKARDAVQAVIGDLPKSAQFSKAMGLESKAVQSKNFILGNSQTARILADMDDMTNTAIGMLGDAATGNVAGVARKGLGAFIGNRKKAGAGKIAESVNRTLQAQPGTPQFKALVERLRGMKNTRKPFPFDRVVESGLRRLSPGRQ